MRNYRKNEETVVYQVMVRIGILFKVEELIRNKTQEERYEEHQKLYSVY
ncbi:MAG: hypothetical protein PUI16_05905 [Clostridia bacterium]|nr:hypothetical protein [Clostridia bacterium]MDY5554829.1 hypothetical protein [Blautia sp.]